MLHFYSTYLRCLLFKDPASRNGKCSDWTFLAQAHLTSRTSTTAVYQAQRTSTTWTAFKMVRVSLYIYSISTRFQSTRKCPSQNPGKKIPIYLWPRSVRRHGHNNVKEEDVHKVIFAESGLCGTMHDTAWYLRLRIHKKHLANQVAIEIGQRSKNQKDLLQGQGLQKAHSTQGHTVQSRQGTNSHPQHYKEEKLAHRDQLWSLTSHANTDTNRYTGLAVRPR